MALSDLLGIIAIVILGMAQKIGAQGSEILPRAPLHNESIEFRKVKRGSCVHLISRHHVLPAQISLDSLRDPFGG